MSEPHQNQRWHDNRGELSLAIDLLESIPAEVLPYIVAGLTDRTNRDFDAAAILGGLKTLGKERIMALHQSQKKRRSYDQSPELHHIVNTFMVLPEEAQETVAAQFVDFTAMMVDYMATCDAFGAEPKAPDLEEMRRRYVEEGTEAVKAYLETIHQKYNQMIALDEPLQEPELVLNTEGDLRLRGSNNTNS